MNAGVALPSEAELKDPQLDALLAQKEQQLAFLFKQTEFVKIEVRSPFLYPPLLLSSHLLGLAGLAFWLCPGIRA